MVSLVCSAGGVADDDPIQIGEPLTDLPDDATATALDGGKSEKKSEESTMDFAANIEKVKEVCAYF